MQIETELMKLNANTDFLANFYALTKNLDVQNCMKCIFHIHIILSVYFISYITTLKI